MKRVARITVLTALMIGLSACTTRINSYRVTDIQSRRAYTAVGQPNFLPGGAISFTDRDSGKMVTLQDYEVEGIEGESYYVRLNPWTNRYELVEQKSKK